MRRLSLFFLVLTAVFAANATDTYKIVGDFTGTTWDKDKGVNFSPITGSIELETTFEPKQGQRFVVLKNNSWENKYITETNDVKTDAKGFCNQLKSIGGSDQYIIPTKNLGRQYFYINPLSMQLTVSPTPLSRRDYVYRIVAPDGWTNFSDIQFNAWNEDGKRLSNDDNRPTISISSIKANVGGQPKTVLEFHMYPTWTPSSVQFIHKDGRSFNCQIDNVQSGVIYTTDGSSIVDEYVADPSKNPIVYFNTGGWTVRNVKVKLYKQGTNDSESGDMGLANPAEPNIWSYTSFADKSRFDAVDITLDLDKKGDGNWETLTMSSVSYEGYDRDRYCDFIYGTGNQMLIQSYLSYSDYRELKDNTKTKVFITGTSNIGLKWKPSVSNGARLIEAEDGVVYFDFEALALTAPEEARLFKISWIDVDKAYDKYYQGTHGEGGLREWASYNLGIVGGIGNYVYADGADGNARTYFDFDKTLRYNNTSEADWAVGGAGRYLTVGQKYWIVLDSHNSCKSITLLSFDPNPNVEVSDLSFELKEIGYENGKNLRMQTPGAYKFTGNAANGYVYNDKVNVVNGTLKLNATQVETVENAGYTVEYDIYNTMEGGTRNKIMTYQGVPDEMHVDYMALGDNIDLELQALYTSTTGLWFHSRYGQSRFSYDGIRFAAPQSNETGSKSLVFKRMNDEGTHGLFTPEMSLSYLVDTDLAYYMDYDVTYPVSDAAHTMAINGEKNWTSHDGSDSEYTDDHNWSKKVIEAQNFTLTAEAAVPVEDETNVDVVIPVNVKAIYPFLVRKQTQVVTIGNASANAPRRVDGAEVFSPEEFALLSGVRTTEVPVKFDSSVTVIETIGVDSVADAPAEYFNLQGVRIAAPQAGQIYIVRRGDKVSKEVMRY